jgi:hypothetical protein
MDSTAQCIIASGVSVFLLFAGLALIYYVVSKYD